MSIKWTISHADRLVEIALAGAFEAGDVERYLAEVADAGGMPYRKIIDLTFAPGDIRLEELKAMMRCTEKYAEVYTLGAVAIIVDCDLSEDTSTFYGERTKVERPFRIFRQKSEALAWLGLPERQDDAVMAQASL